MTRHAPEDGTRRAAATRVAAGICLLMLCAGCGGLRAKGIQTRVVSSRMMAPERPEREPEPVLRADHRPTTQPLVRLTPELHEIIRPGNPAGWGQSARIEGNHAFGPVFFDEDREALDTAAERRLDETAEWLALNPRVWITLVGFCGETHTREYGLSLSMARALAVEDYLVQREVDPGRIFPIAYGLLGPSDAEQTATIMNRVELIGFTPPVGAEAPEPIRGGPTEAPSIDAPTPLPRARDLP